ncbi:sugar nucleotide-binding protein [Clostridium oryzae]|uniref:dTDP-4-dehydrorhamnose reductase n=1 Tax=Clostridium oryzae TaxID=1450648 RepID=A0A1V4IDP8_9CLOT|nr:sugar nucleotide-binding protein [Clostridium oryzae]OPJ58056.1 dTDP-4-dehydrorhamnose reductase [Clostridium oryzae]
MKKVLILGGSGLIGKAIAEEMRGNEQLDVYGTYNSNLTVLDKNKSLKLNIEDLADTQHILTAVQPEIVISCIRGEFDKQLIFHRKVAEYLNENGGKLYFFSTTNVFDGDTSKPHYEEDKPNSITDYGKFKIACEDMLMNILHQNACILRIPQVWGKESPRMKQLIDAQRNKKKIKVYSGIFVNTNTDVCIAKKTCYIIDKDLKGIFHLSADDMMDYKDIYNQLVLKLELKNVKFDEEISEGGYFAILSKRQQEFPNDFRISNRLVIDYLTN